MTRSLGEIILNLGTTYATQLAFRDEVLNTSGIGRRFVKTYYRYNPKALELVIVNPTLLGQAIHAWLVIAPFVGAVVASSASEGNVRAGTGRPMRLTRAMHGRMVEVLRTLRRLTSDKGLRRALTEVEAELRNYVGLTPEEALQTIRRSSRRAARPLRRRK